MQIQWRVLRTLGFTLGAIGWAGTWVLTSQWRGVSWGWWMLGGYLALGAYATRRPRRREGAAVASGFDYLAEVRTLQATAEVWPAAMAADRVTMVPEDALMPAPRVAPPQARFALRHGAKTPLSPTPTPGVTDGSSRPRGRRPRKARSATS